MIQDLTYRSVIPRFIHDLSVARINKKSIPLKSKKYAKTLAYNQKMIGFRRVHSIIHAEFHIAFRFIRQLRSNNGPQIFLSDETVVCFKKNSNDVVCDRYRPNAS